MAFDNTPNNDYRGPIEDEDVGHPNQGNSMYTQHGSLAQRQAARNNGVLYIVDAAGNDKGRVFIDNGDNWVEPGRLVSGVPPYAEAYIAGSSGLSSNSNSPTLAASLMVTPRHTEQRFLCILEFTVTKSAAGGSTLQGKFTEEDTFALAPSNTIMVLGPGRVTHYISWSGIYVPTTSGNPINIKAQMVGGNTPSISHRRFMAIAIS